MLNQSVLMKIAAAVCFAAGFAVASQSLDSGGRLITVKEQDVLRAAPSVTAELCPAAFKSGEELLVLQTVKLHQPTAVVMLKDIVVEGEGSVKYRLAKGSVYKLADAQLDKANQPCIIQAQTNKEQQVKLPVAKSDAAPIDEGVWVQVRQRDGGQSAWLRSGSKWY